MSTNMEDSTLLHFDTIDTSAREKRIIPSDATRLAQENGAIYEPRFLSHDESEFLLELVDGQAWSSELKRRVQHYGWKYDYSSRFITEDMRAEPLPYFIRTVAEMLTDRGWFKRLPDQVIVNEYMPNQGIAPHVDRDCFGPAVATLSLGDCWPMQLARVGQGRQQNDRWELNLAVGSALVLRGDARNKWTHGIAKRRYNAHGHGKRKRQRRVSITFRTVEHRR